MINRIYLIAALIINSSSAFAQTWDWANRAGGYDADNGTCIVADESFLLQNMIHQVM